jgi:hypothetical protein
MILEAIRYASILNCLHNPLCESDAGAVGRQGPPILAPIAEAVDDGPGADATPEAASDAGAPLLVNDVPGALLFNAWVCQFVTKPFVVTNAGDGPTGPLILVPSDSATFPLTRNDCGGVALAAGASCLMEVGFRTEVPPSMPTTPAPLISSATPAS